MNHAYAFGLVSLFVVGSAAAFTACSSSSDSGGGGNDSGVKDSGSSGDSGVTTDSGSGGDTGTPVDTGSSDDTGTDGGCSTPGTLHPPSPDAGTSTIYCPFSGADGGPNVYCTGQTQHCCETPASAGTPSTCQDLATACSVAKSTDWQCQDPKADCPTAKPICCATGASIGLGAPGCGNFAHTMTGTTCVATGGCSGGITMCTSDDECPTGQHCTPFSKAGAQVGGCM